jgi:hypothetical protein
MSKTETPYFRDKVLNCSDCKEEFVWAWQDQRDLHAKEQELAKTRPNIQLNPPQICPICRRRRRKEDERIQDVRKKQEARMKEEIQKERSPVATNVTIEAGIEVTMTKQ